MKYVVGQPDLISNSYFPALAAVELGFFNDEGIDAEIEMISPVPDAFVALRDGECHFVAGPAHAALWAFPRWQGAKMLCALSQGMYWFLVVRKDLDIEPGDLTGLSGLTLGAAPGPDMGFRQLLISAGIDVEKENISIGLPPGGLIPGASFGVSAAEALIEGKIDGFWANGIGFLNEDVGWIGGYPAETLQTVDGGESWEPIQIDLAYGDVINRFVKTSEDVVYAVGNRVYKYAPEDEHFATEQCNEPRFKNADCSIEARVQNNVATITYTVPEYDKVILTIFIRGSLIYDRPIDTPQKAGTYTIEWELPQEYAIRWEQQHQIPLQSS